MLWSVTLEEPMPVTLGQKKNYYQETPVWWTGRRDITCKMRIRRITPSTQTEL